MRLKQHQARLRHARAYPFSIPEASYLYANGAARPLAPGEAFTDRHYEDRVPVIACGSNRSPERLANKYPEPDAVIPVERARLNDCDVVYSAHITRYGSVPATLARAPGTRVEVSVNWLTEAQLEVMHATEGSYDYLRLERIELALEGDGGWQRRLDTAFTYWSRQGALHHEGEPVAMQAARADNRSFAALSQTEVQAAVHARLGGGRPIDAFILENIDNPRRRRDRIMELQADANPLDWPHASVPGI
ncbi:MAG: hypothetical protein QNJ92_00615 [Alphaproteobacteria bacterium]|nr:hypothetical protein [Alphaproteobacteria bacterium]